MQTELGTKIKHFRKRNRLSQFDLEINIGASPGSLSRIENGEINPTKETLFKLAKELSLSTYEKEYLFGVTDQPATEEEVKAVLESLKELFSRRGVLAYVGDERGRLWGVSESFRKLLKITPEQVKEMSGDHLFRIVFDPKMGLFDRLDPEYSEELIRSLISRNLIWEMGYMQEDFWYKRAVEYIRSNPVSSRIYDELLATPPENFTDVDNRTVYFKVHGARIKMHFSKEPVPKFERFKVIQYFPNNAIINLLSKIL